MIKIKFLLDENLSRAIQRGLHLANPDIQVLLVSGLGAPPKGTSDPDILIWLEINNYILVSDNRRTMPNHFRDHIESGRIVLGILLIKRGTSIGQVIDELLLIWEASEVSEYQNIVRYLPL